MVQILYFSLSHYSSLFHSISSLQSSPVTLTRGGLTVLLELLTGLSLVAFRTCAVEVLVHAVTLGLILTRVWITSISRGAAMDLMKPKGEENSVFRIDTDIITMEVIFPCSRENPVILSSKLSKIYDVSALCTSPQHKHRNQLSVWTIWSCNLRRHGNVCICSL